MHLSVICDSRIWEFDKHIESFQHNRLDPSQRTITFGIGTAACKTVLCSTWIFGPQRFTTCAYSTAGRDKVYDQGKRILCTLHGTGKPMATESRKVNCRRPLIAVTGLFWTAKTRFQFFFFFENRAKDRVHADTWWMGSDHEVGATGEPTK